MQLFFMRYGPRIADISEGPIAEIVVPVHPCHAPLAARVAEHVYIGAVCLIGVQKFRACRLYIHSIGMRR